MYACGNLYFKLLKQTYYITHDTKLPVSVCAISSLTSHIHTHKHTHTAREAYHIKAEITYVCLGGFILGL